MTMAGVEDKLRRPVRVWSAVDVRGPACKELKAAGVYAWYFDCAPGETPLAGSHQWQGHWLLYVGISPSSAPKKGTTARPQTVARRLKQHYGGNASSSTLRLTLGCLLKQEIGAKLRLTGSSARLTFGEAGEHRLSEWMGKHTRIAWAPCDAPWDVEPRLISTLLPPLNLDHNGCSEFRPVLRELRRAARTEARLAAAG